jgi:hypothetical protein
LADASRESATRRETRSKYALIHNGDCVEKTVTTTTTTATVPDRPEARARQRVSGTITSVTGHMVTVQQSAQSLVINDSPALQHQASGRVAVGRQITAHGYWEAGTFYATRIERLGISANSARS